ncbi:hypothetical protein LDI01_12540 [Lentilactobacillus diolivorans]|uniref:Phage protein n=1 Tax=Lentilactobacillus diolivorans TaxID=179838 RepID=A0ABQ0XC54_9LACO|nr:hypothetical protein LDI01_12540 [Lentilactobacillus diolivorans]
MFRRFSYFIFDKYKQWAENLEDYFKKNPNKRKIFDWLIGNNPLSGYDLSTMIIVCVIIAVMTWVIKKFFY